MKEAEIAEDRSGFTLPNLVAIVCVALTLLGIIVALISAATGNGGTSSRMYCMNNQKEIWQAIQVFESRRQRYPGWRTPLAGRQVGWPVQLMPYLGMNDQYNLWATPGSKLTMPGISVYLCPNDNLKTSDAPWLSYVVNCGLPDATIEGGQVETSATGMFFDNVVTDTNTKPIFTTARDVAKKDGLTHTIGLGENLRAFGWTGYPLGSHTVQEYLVGFNWMYYAETPTEHWLRYPINQRRAPDEELISATATNSEAARLNGPHGNVVVVTFADGHSMFLNEQIDERVYNKLCTPDGSYQIREDWPVQEPLDFAEFIR